MKKIKVWGNWVRNSLLSKLKINAHHTFIWRDLSLQLEERLEVEI